jgi:hypothetical protein
MPQSRLAPALLVALLVVAATNASASVARAERSLTLRLISTPTSQSVVDVAPNTAYQGQLTRGDAVRGTSALANAVRQLGKAKGIRVGNDGFVITVGTPPNARITVHVTLPGGTLSASGLVRLGYDGEQTIQVVGGTGTFEGARGTVSSSGLPDGRSSNVYALRLP